MRLLTAIALYLMLTAGCGGGSESPDGDTNDGDQTPDGDTSGGEIRGTTTDARGIPLAGVAVTGQGPEAFSTTTDADGRFAAADLEPGSYRLAFARDGYTGQWQTVVVKAGASAPTSAGLLKRSPPATFDAGTGVDLHSRLDRIAIPPGALLKPDGSPASGPATIRFSSYDLSIGEARAFPGPFRGRETDGGEVPIESFGLAEIVVEQDGAPLQLAPGASATLELALPEATPLARGAMVPAWWFDEETGIWVEEGEGRVGRSSLFPDRLAWVAEIPHLSYWNCDVRAENYCFTGRLFDETGNPHGAEHMPVVSSWGIDYTGFALVNANPDGSYCIEARKGSSAEIRYSYTGISMYDRETVVTPDINISCSDPAAACGSLGDHRLPTVNCLSGQVVDRDGNPVGNVAVTASGIGHTWRSDTDLTDINGRYCVAVRADDRVRIEAVDTEWQLTVSTTAEAPSGRAGCGSGDCGEAETMVLATSCVAGSLFDIAGGPVAGARTVFSSLGSSTVSGPDGYYCLSAPADRPFRLHTPGFYLSRLVTAPGPIPGSIPSCTRNPADCETLNLYRIAGVEIDASSEPEISIMIDGGGAEVTIWADGEITLEPLRKEREGTGIGPDGLAGSDCSTGCPLPGAPRGALIGRFGTEGTRFIVGERYQAALDGASELRLVVNDDRYTDNGGSFFAKVGIDPQPQPPDGDADEESPPDGDTGADGDADPDGETQADGDAAPPVVPFERLLPAVSGANLHDLWGNGTGDLWAVGSERTILHRGPTGWQAADHPWPFDPNCGGGDFLAVWGSPDGGLYLSGTALQDSGCNELRGIVRYRDGVWSLIDPAPGSNRGHRFTDIWGSSEADIYLVGTDYGTGARGYHYDGGDWTALPPEIFGDAELWAGWGSSAGDVFLAGGRYLMGGYDYTAAIFHWNGSAWREFDLQGAYGVITSLWGSGPDDVWGVGFHNTAYDIGVVFHYDGSDWTSVETGVSLPHLDAVWGRSSSDVYVVGRGLASGWGAGDGVIIRFDGSAWTPLEAGSHPDLGAVWGDGERLIASGRNGVILEHESAGWTRPAGNPFGQASFRSIVGGSATDLWLFGSRLTYWTGTQRAYELLAAHWDGREWRAELREPAVWSGNAEPGLTSGWKVATGEVFAAGSNGTSPVLYRSDRAGGDWVDLAVGLSGVTRIDDIWASSADDAWAVARDAVDRSVLLHCTLAGCRVAETGLPVGELALTAICGYGPDDVWVAGLGVLRFDGQAWYDVPIRQDSLPVVSFDAIDCGPDGLVIAAGRFGVASGGAAFGLFGGALDLQGPVEAIAVPSAARAWVVGWEVVRWDGRWQVARTPGVWPMLRDVWAPSEETVFLVGDHGLFRHTGTR